jgi:S1-C subfamily serine protease
VDLKRGFDGKVSRIKMNSVKLSAANVGGVAINDAGQTVGIVASIERNEAVILPPAVISGAAARVLARKGSVPRPWLGVSGESLAFTSLEGIVKRGWEPARAQSLIRNQSGILLTSITPGSPAEIAALRAGDVIVRVNNNEVKNTDDFSVLLETAGANPVHFTIVRPDNPQPESVTVKLSEVLAPSFTVPKLWALGSQAVAFNPLIRQGIETIPLGPAAATRFNSSGGLLVVFVQSQTPASTAGLRPTDVIEAINGQPILRKSVQEFQQLTGASYTLNVIRDRQKLVLTVEAATP